jgi:hypothetical protein
VTDKDGPGPDSVTLERTIAAPRETVFDAWLTADDASLPDDPEFRSALVAYAEWGTRLRSRDVPASKQEPGKR